MKTFEQELKAICDDSYKKNLYWRMLAKTRKLVGLDERWLGAKLRLVGQVVGESLEQKVYGVGARQGEKVVYISNIESFYSAVAKYVQINLTDRTNEFTDLMFDGSEEDRHRLVNVLRFVLEFEKTLCEAVNNYRSEDGSVRGSSSRLSLVKFANNFIYFHFSQASFLFDRKIDVMSKRLFNIEECKLNDAIVPDAVKCELFFRYKNVSDYILKNVEVLRIPKYSDIIWIRDYYARAYALACYLVKHGYTDLYGQYSTATLVDIFENVDKA